MENKKIMQFISCATVFTTLVTSLAGCQKDDPNGLTIIDNMKSAKESTESDYKTEHSKND